MAIPDRKTYLCKLVNELKKQWPENRTVNIVCHGHSVPAGYFATPYVDTFNSYPHLLHRKLKERFPFAVINVIVTAIGGENSISGAKRFKSDVLSLKPDLVLIDYGLNDRNLPEKYIRKAWVQMLSGAKDKDVYVLLLTPSWDINTIEINKEPAKLLRKTAEVIREVACQNEVGLVEVFSAFEREFLSGRTLESMLSWVNHPSSIGHSIIVNEILSWFPF